MTYLLRPLLQNNLMRYGLAVCLALGAVVGIRLLPLQAQTLPNPGSFSDTGITPNRRSGDFFRGGRGSLEQEIQCLQTDCLTIEPDEVLTVDPKLQPDFESWLEQQSWPPSGRVEVEVEQDLPNP